MESGATSTIVQPTPALTESAINGVNNLSSVISPSKVSTTEEEPVAEVKTEEVGDDKERKDRAMTPT